MTVCEGCLSTRRKLVGVGALIDVYMLLVSTSDTGVECGVPALQTLCWECVAGLRAASRLRERLARALSRQISEGSLSRLTWNYRTGEDYTAQCYGAIERNADIQCFSYADDQHLETKKSPNSEIKSELLKSDDASVRRSKRTSRRSVKLAGCILTDNKQDLIDLNQELIDHNQELIDYNHKLIDCKQDLYDSKHNVDSIIDNFSDDTDSKSFYRNSKNEFQHTVKRKVGKHYSEKLGKKRTLKMSEEQMLQRRVEMAQAARYVEAAARCQTCIIGFSNDTLLEMHNKLKHSDEAGPHKCDICGVRTLSDIRLQAHRRGHYSQRACACGLPRHAHETADCEPAPHRCHICGQTFMKQRALRYHRECAHKARQKCQHCGREFNNTSTFKRHLMLHTGMPTYECGECGKWYRGAHGLRAHLRSHARAPPEDAFCIECNLQLKNKYLYRHHLKTSSAHADPATFRFPCTLCERRFFVSSQLRTHLDTVHLKRRDHKCVTCAKAFSDRYKLKAHVRNAHDATPPERKHVCETCGKRFKNKQTMKRHQPIHTGERKYKCDVCAATFKQPAALWTHNKLLHGKAAQSTVD